MRRAVHAAFGVPVLFYPAGSRTVRLTNPPLTARYHSKMQVAGDPVGGGYAQMLEGVNRVVLSREQLSAAGVVLKQGDVLAFPDYLMRVRLDIKDVYTGPINETWSVGVL